MAEHYYTARPSAAHEERRFEAVLRGERLTFKTDAGVFSKAGVDAGTKLLIEALPELSDRVLDLGCGWGPVGAALAKHDPGLQVVMTDINERAAGLARENLRLNGVNNAEVVTGDGYAAVTGRFSAVITNPPIRAGKQTIYGLFADARDHLDPGGCLYIVIRKQQGAPSAVKYLQGIYREVEIIARGGGYWVIRAERE